MKHLILVKATLPRVHFHVRCEQSPGGLPSFSKIWRLSLLSARRATSACSCSSTTSTCRGKQNKTPATGLQKSRRPVYAEGLLNQMPNGCGSKPCTPGEYRNGWQMDVHPPQNGAIGCAPLPNHSVQGLDLNKLFFSWLFGCLSTNNMAMGQNPIPPVNIPIPTKID